MRRLVPLATALALAGAVLVPTTTAAAPAPAAAAATKKPTAYAFTGGGFGTRIRGGEVPAASGRTAYRAIGCTNLAGLHRTNEVAEVEIPGLGRVQGIKTSLRTQQNKSGTSTVSRHNVAKVVLAESALGRLAIKGVKSFSKATATPTGYETETQTKLLSLVFEPPNGGEPQQLDLPTPGQPIVVPGLLRIAIGDVKEKKTADFARAAADALKITLIPTDTKVVIAHSYAYITKGIKTGLFSGSADTTSTKLLGGVAGTGNTQHVQMPCQGTDGVVKTNDAAGLNLPGALEVGAATARQMGKQTGKVALGFEEAAVASVNLGDGALQIDAVKGRVSVQREKGKKPKVSFDGSQVAGITVDGETYTLPELDGLEIPGLVKIETLIREKLTNGGRITALRLTLLDGSGAVVDIGKASLRIYPSRR